MALGFPESVLVAYPTKGKAAAFTVPSNQQLYVYNARTFNNTGSAQNAGICRKHILSQYGLWQLTDGGTVYTEQDLSDLSGGIEIFSGTNDDGFIVQDQRRFNVLGLTISDTGSGGVYTYAYWNGTTFSSLTTLEVPAYTSAADVWLAFRAPQDWVPGGPSEVDATRYSIKVISTTAPGSSVEISDLWIGEFLEFYDNVPSKAVVQLSFPDTKPFALNGGEGLFPYFTTAGASNQFGCYYSAKI